MNFRLPGTRISFNPSAYILQSRITMSWQLKKGCWSLIPSRYALSSHLQGERLACFAKIPFFNDLQSSAPEARLSSPLSPFPRSSSSSHVSAPLSPTPSLLHPNSASPARASRYDALHVIVTSGLVSEWFLFRNTVLGASGNLSSSVKAASIADVRMSSPSGTERCVWLTYFSSTTISRWKVTPEAYTYTTKSLLSITFYSW